MTVLEGAGVLHRPFLRSFRGVGIFSVARHVSAQQLRLWLCSLRELPFSMQKKPSSCATAFMASSSKKRQYRVIGKMGKSDLVEVARKELGMSSAEANAKTRDILREKIRINRRLNKKPPGLRRGQVNLADWLRITRALKHCLVDPLALPPSGICHMKLPERRDEVLTRGLPVIPDATRWQMWKQIQEDADARWTSTVDEHGFQKTATTIAEAQRRSAVDEDYEWMREYLVEIDTVGERESDAINQNLENKKEEDMTDD